MSEPTSNNIGLVLPNTGDLSGTWGADAVNPNMTALDGYVAGVQSISLTSGTVTLTAPAGYTPTPGAGPTQAQNKFLNLSGSLSGNVTLQLPMPGSYIINNQTTPSTFFIYVGNSGLTGGYIALEPYGIHHVGFDGTNARYLDLPLLGTYVDMAASSMPAWITNCSTPPYLNCDGSTFSSGTYPALAPPWWHNSPRLSRKIQGHAR
jgi:hypothetical protein